MNVLLIDNRDSFTFNLAEAFRVAGAQVAVVRNSIEAAVALRRALEMDATIIRMREAASNSLTWRGAECRSSAFALAIRRLWRRPEELSPWRTSHSTANARSLRIPATAHSPACPRR